MITELERFSISVTIGIAQRAAAGRPLPGDCSGEAREFVDQALAVLSREGVVPELFPSRSKTSRGQ